MQVRGEYFMLELYWEDSLEQATVQFLQLVIISYKLGVIKEIID